MKILTIAIVHWFLFIFAIAGVFFLGTFLPLWVGLVLLAVALFSFIYKITVQKYSEKE